MTDVASPAAATGSSMRRDVASAYAATAAKIGSWVIVSGLVYRCAGAEDFAVLALIRGTIGILNYTALGLSPAMIRLLAEARRSSKRELENEITYFNASREGIQTVYSNGLMIALVCAGIGFAAAIAFAWHFNQMFRVPPRLLEMAPAVAGAMGFGTVIRLVGDAPGSVLQSHGQIARDNFTIAAGEVIWVLLSLSILRGGAGSNPLWMAAFAYAVSGAGAFILRDLFASRLTQIGYPRWRLLDEKIIRRLLAFGGLVLFAQLADYLYAPTDYILINRLLGWQDVAVYTPAMQLDAGLLLLVTGLSSVILPRTALAHTAGEVDRVRRYYIVGTIFSALLLLGAALVVWLMAGILFRAWLGDPMRATRVILPLVLVHTVVGGSSAVGRSILLGMGKVRPFTIAVLLAGASNVFLSYIFVRYLNLGLKGIVLGTIVAVVARCAVWMPWYVLRSLREPAAGEDFRPA
jgi:O-antigen/teichoic acid export membrane protein